APRQPRVGRFVRRGPEGKRLQPRARVPALERLPHTRWRQAVDYHGVRPLCDHTLAARRILIRTISRKGEEKEMSTTMVASEVKAVPPVVSSIQDIPLEKICESKTNPRTQFDPTKLAELAENIRQHGVLQPILVRPLPKGAADTYELVAGARRYRASKLARRESIPATVRELTDAQALELQVIENVQRVDVHPLDEAQGYAALIELQPNT